MPKATQLLLLADHIKLSLLERQRAISLNLEPNSHDGQISRSLESLREGIDAAEADGENEITLGSIRDQYRELSTQFYGHPSGPVAPTVTQPNDPSLAPDFATAQQTRKSVRFYSPRSSNDGCGYSDNQNSSFPSTYRDNPSETADDEDGEEDVSNLTNRQIHEHHAAVIAEQDEQLDALSASIGRQRHLSMAIGDELEGHVALLEEVDGHVDRHQGRLDHAMRRMDDVRRKAENNWGGITIAILVIVLVLLIIILK